MAHSTAALVQAPPEASGFHTADMVYALNAASPTPWPRYETVCGELLVTPAPGMPHQWIVGELHAELRSYLARERVGIAMLSPADIRWGRVETAVQPDVFVIPMDVWQRPPGERQWSTVRHLRLAAEIVSPRTRTADRFTKRRLYQQQGVEVYWAIDPERRLAEVWTPGAELPQVERERLLWHPADAGEPFTFDLAVRFAEFEGL